MGMKRNVKFGSSKRTRNEEFRTMLRVGDVVMVISGGNSKSGKVLKGLKGKVLRFLPKKNRVVVEGLNFVKRHKKAKGMGDSFGVIVKEGSIAVSNVMYYSEQLTRPVRLRCKILDDQRKVRGFLNPQTEQFEQIDIGD